MRPPSRKSALASRAPTRNALASLRVDGCLPTFQGDLHGWLVKRRYFRASVGYKNVQSSEFLLRPAKHPADVVRSTDIALNNEPIGSKPAYLGKRIVGGNLIAAVVDCY